MGCFFFFSVLRPLRVIDKSTHSLRTSSCITELQPKIHMYTFCCFSVYFPLLFVLFPCCCVERWPHTECVGAVGSRVSGEQCPAAPPYRQVFCWEGVSEGEVSHWLCGKHHWRWKGMFQLDQSHEYTLRPNISALMISGYLAVNPYVLYLVSFQISIIYFCLDLSHRLSWWMMRAVIVIRQTEGAVLSTCSWSGFWVKCLRRILRWSVWPQPTSPWLSLLGWQSGTLWTEFCVCLLWRPSATWPTRCVLHPHLTLCLFRSKSVQTTCGSPHFHSVPLSGGPVCDWVGCSATVRRASSHATGWRGCCCSVTVRHRGSGHSHRGAAH